MTSSISSVRLPSLPTELFIGIIGHLCQYTKDHDPAYLWTEGRNVSKLFRQKVERLFIAKFLRKTWIQFHFLATSLNVSSPIDVSQRDSDESTDSAEPRVRVSFSFDRLSKDGQLAFFQSDATFFQSSGFGEIDQDLIFDRIDELSPDELNDGHQLVRIRSSVHDIYIPDLEVDKTSKEISLNWRNLFSIFFAEEMMYNRIMQRWDPARAPRAPMWQPSTDSESPSFMKKMDMLFIQEKAARLLARRSRVQRQNQDLKGESIFVGEDYSLTEQNALKEVEMSALLASFEMDSDDEEVKLSVKREG